MSQAPTPPSGPSVWRQIQQQARANPLATAIAAYAITAILAILAAYFRIFSEFIPYDDEGTVSITVRAFVHGDALYKDIWSVYGPFYYEIYGGFFKLTGISIGTDATRTITVLVWVFTSFLFGLAGQRLSGRLSLGLTGMVAAFAALGVLANEPGHPQGLAIALIAALALFAAIGDGRRPTFSGVACGVVLAALVLTKVNLGVYAVAGVVLACALTVEPIHRIRWLRWLIVLAFLAMPLFVLARDLDEAWVREFALVQTLAMLAVVVASLPLWPRRGEADGGTMRWTFAAIAGFVVAAVIFVVAILPTGPSISDVYDGIVKEAFGIRNVLKGIFSFPVGVTVDGAIAAVAAAAVVARLRLGGRSEAPSLWPGVLRAIAGSLILLAVAQLVPFADNPTSGDPDVVPLLLAWVIVIPPTGVVEPPYRRLLRVLLAAVAVAETLQVYPVPGSQMGIAAAAYVPVGVFCLSDALHDLRSWSAVRGTSSLRAYGVTLGVLAVAVPAMFVVNSIVLPGIESVRTYRHQPQLRLPGADLLHLAPPQGEIYEQAVGLLHENHCSTFVGMPNINSLYFWAQLDSPQPQIPNGWMYGLNDSQQRRAVEELKASPRPCYLLNEELSPFYLHGEPAPATPLVEYVEKDFRASGQAAGSFQLFLPKPDATN